MAKISTQLIIEGVNNTKKMFSDVDSSLGGMSDSAKKAGVALAGALSVGVFAAWIAQSIDAADQTSELAERIGIAADKLGELQYAARFAGFEQEAFAGTMVKFSQNINKAVEGSAAQVNAFALLGVTVKNSAGEVKSADALFLEVADSISKLPDGAMKGALAMDLFGKAGAQLLPILNSGAGGIGELIQQGRDLGLILSTEAYDAAGQFNDNMDVLGQVTEGVGLQIAAELLPTLNTMTGLMADVSKESGIAVGAANVLGVVLKALAVVAVVVGTAFQTTGRLIGAAAAAAMAAATGDFAGAGQILRDVVEDNTKTTNDMQVRIAKIMEGGYEKDGQQAADNAREWEKVQKARVDAAKASAEESAQAYKDLAADAKTSLGDLVRAEKDANKEIEDIQKSRLDIEKRYAEASAQFRAGGAAQSPSYAQAQVLSIAARQALDAGDTEGAQEQAQAALRVLEDLAAAGENTYGFEGFAQGLKAIEMAAKDVEQSNAEDKLVSLGGEIKALQEQLDKITRVDIKVELDPEAKAKLLIEMQALAVMIGQTLIVQPTILPPAGTAAPDGSVYVPAVAPIPGHANGTDNAPPGMAWVGEEGPELVRFKGGEQVLTNNASMRLMSQYNAGALGDAAATVAAASPAMEQLGSLRIDVGGESVNVMANNSEALNLKRLAAKHGRTTKR